MKGGSVAVRPRRLSGVAMGLLGCAASVGMLASLEVPATASTSQSKLVQEGMTFYKGKTIKLISPDDPGGGFDVNARIIGPAVASYLHATVDITNIGAGNTVAGQNAMASSPNDGLTIGMVNPGTDIENKITGVPGVNFDPLQTAFLGATPAPGGAGFSCLTSSPYKTFADVVNSKTPVSEVIQTTGTLYVTLLLYNAAFNIKGNLLTGYASTADQVQGWERGDGDCTDETLAPTGSFIASGKAKVLMKVNDPEKGTAYASIEKNTPLISTWEKKFPAKTQTEKNARAAIKFDAVGHEFNAPKGTAPDKVAALQVAFKSAMENPAVQKKLLQAEEPTGYLPPATVKADYVQEQKALTALGSILKAKS